MDKIYAPFTCEQVEALNLYQNSGKGHPFTCCSHEGCLNTGKGEENRILIAKEEGWECPCGIWKQTWAWEFMEMTGHGIAITEAAYGALERIKKREEDDGPQYDK